INDSMTNTFFISHLSPPSGETMQSTQMLFEATLTFRRWLASQVTVIYKAFLQCRLCQSSFTVLNLCDVLLCLSGVSCSDEDEKPRKRRRTNSSSSSPVLLKEVPKVATPISKTITVPVSGSPKMSNLMQSIANSLPPHMSPVKITFTKPCTQTTNSTTQKVIIVTTSPSSNFVPNILSKSHNYAAVSKLVSSAALSASSHKQTMVISAGSAAALGPSPVAVTTTVPSTPSVVMSTIAQGECVCVYVCVCVCVRMIFSIFRFFLLPQIPDFQIVVSQTNIMMHTSQFQIIDPYDWFCGHTSANTISAFTGTSTKITTIPMTSKPNVIVVQKTTGKGTTIQGLPGKNVVTTLLNAGGEKTLQAVPGAKPAIITASRPITKMIVAQPKSLGAGVQPSTKIIPTKIVYGQQGKTQVLIKPKPMAFQTAVVSEQTRQLVSETLQQVSRSAESGQEGAHKDDSPSYTETSDSTHDAHPVVHLITSRGQEWTEQEVSVEASPTIIYQDMTGESQSATSTIKALLELQQTSVKEKSDARPRQNTIDLSQMAVPIPVTERRQSPEPSGQSAGDTDTVTEYIPIGNLNIRAESPKYMKSGIKCCMNSKKIYVFLSIFILFSITPLKVKQSLYTFLKSSRSQILVSVTSQKQAPPPIHRSRSSVTKITFGAHQCPPVSSSAEASVKLQPESSSSRPAPEKPSDILKISMMEAEIEPMVVDSSSDCGPLTKTPSASPLISSSKQTLAHGAFGRVKSKDLDIIQVIPQYSIMPDSSQSNVVVEPSGFLEISDYTSQRLDEEAAMEQEVDSSNDEGAAASPTADQSQ
uniref:EMSY transcriptional repressor, BRCA2 interacting n=1 Tax=Cyprinus carpio TaxID=7962 RepID=A0A8C2C878_CYPCA